MRRVILPALATFAALAPLTGHAQSSPSDFTYATRYDGERRVVGTIAPDPDGPGSLHYAATRTTYDDTLHTMKVESGELSGWQDETVAPSGWSGFTVSSQVVTELDALDRKVRETLSSGGTTYSVTQYSYDSFGRLDCTAVRMNAAVFGSLPSSVCTASTAGSNGPDRITRNVYDAAGQLLTVVKAYGTSLQQDYATYTYTTNGKQATVKDANGNKAGYTYDGFDRLVTWAFPDKTSIGTISSTDYEAYTYDAGGNRTSLRKRDGRTLSYSYDALNRVTVKVIPDACVSGYACTTPPSNAVRDVYYGYDLRGLQTFARFDSASGSDGVSAAYDGLGRLGSETIAMGGTSRAASYQYDADGNRVRVTYPDSAYFTYAYDGLDRMTAVALSGSTTIATMAYNADGQQVGETRAAVSTTLGYDPAGRLASLADDLSGTTSDVTSTFAYSPASQLITKTRSNTAYAWTGYVNVSRAYAVNGLNQYTTAGSATFGYDSNGNLASDGTSSYTYDAENRLVADNAGTTLTYDPLGRLYLVATSASTESYLYAGDQRIAEYDASGNMTARYVVGGGTDNSLIWYAGSTTTSPRSLQGDAQGSIVSVTDASGAILAINSYDEYGIPASGNLGRYGYTGQLWVPQLGLFYYKARFYSPTLGRFMQTDPIGYDDGLNWYAYVANDPMDGTDPTGLQDASNWKQRVVDTVNGAAEILVGVLVVGGGDGAAGTAEVATGGLATPVAAPLAVAATAGGLALIGDGFRRVVNGSRPNIQRNAPSGPNGSRSGGGRSSRGGGDRQKGQRSRQGDDHEQQYREISRAQKDVRIGKSNQIIDSVKKSQQRADQALRSLTGTIKKIKPND